MQKEDSPFTIDISSLLSSHLADHEDYSFEDEVDNDVFHEIVIQSTLVVKFQLVRRQYGVELRIKELQATVDVPEDHIIGQPVYLHDISREYHLDEKIEDTDDIEYIDKNSQSVDIGRVVEQEVLISCLV